MQAPPTLDRDPYGEGILADPYAFYAELREIGPVAYIPAHGVYAVGRYDAVKQVFSDHARFTSESGVGIQDARDPAQKARPKSLLVEIDPPAHTANRRAANRIMSPLIIRSFRQVFEERARALVDAVLARGGDCDGVADLAEDLVLTGFPKAMGLRHNPEAIRAIGYMSFNQTGPKNALHEKGLAAGEPYMEWFLESCQPEHVRPGSLADEFYRAEAAGEVEPGFAANVIRSLVRGGSDSTMAGIGFAIHQLARNPDQWALLQANPGRRRFVYDEALRHESPFHVVYRAVVGQGAELDGFALEGGMKIGMYPGAANRDPRQWERPDAFDILRDSAGVHLSFGTGDHNCIGQNIARLEADALLAALMERVARIDLAGPPAYRLHNQLRTLDTLPLRLIAA
ncbi:cytochrome P450 [Ruixingdingia sedimenti]|uniref:Cytochrome P450 n=1 Tax=Ruixingdingia sedimenti TaxID=3073604 RepID=A0ABU1F4E0_9RHOB|nr:cytochrome P450 [Xinfangfangia sp. LG-4]MDR5651730.1 cytochrome P450 [Xinfangfangia sp. LG-4]